MNKLHDSWRSYLTETKLRVFDFDDTLVKSDSKIKVTDPGGKQSTLTSGEYATHKKDQRNEYDFSEFDKLINPREVKKVTSILRNVVGAGTDGRQNVILTARDSAAEDSIQDYLEEIGIDTSKIDFVLLGDSTPIAKSRWIEDKIRTGATDVLFLDDSGKNVEAVLDLKEKYPDVKIDARRVGYAEEIEEQMINERYPYLEPWLDTTGYNNPTAHERSPIWSKMQTLMKRERSQELKYQSDVDSFERDPEHPHFEKNGPPVEPVPDPELEEFKDNHNMFVDFMWNLDDPSNTFFKRLKARKDWEGISSIDTDHHHNRLMHAKFKWLFPYDVAPGLGCKNKILYLDALVASFYDNPSLYEIKLDERLEVKYDPEVSRPKTVYEKCKVELQHRKDARKATAQEMGAEEYRVDALEEQLLENTERLIKEVTEDEIAHIADVLNGLDPKDLAFNRLFGDKFRLAIDFPTLDTSSELGQFIDLWRVMGYTVDWDKGTVSGDRRLRDVSPAGFANQILDMDSGKGEPQTKKINMKIGKWLTKLLGYQTKYQALRQKVEDYYSKEGPGAPRGLWKQGRRPPGGYTGNQTEKALSEEDLKNYYRLESYIYMMARAKDDPFPQQLESVQSIQKLIFYWRDNAAYIKKNLDKASGNKYSIIITRHPLDVLRMSDYENIQSCHSPPSRGGASKEYKCAVAEAHGHGAVAYVVNTEDLTATTGADASIEDVNSDPAFQDGEIFFDDERPYGNEGVLAPYSRLRVRQVKYYEHTKDPETYDERNPYEGVELAVPEKRRYGLQIPGLVERMVDWAKENQKEQIEGAPIYMTTRGGTKQIDLDQFIKFGGSYEDNVINRLIKELWPKDADVSFNGSIVQDTDTEDNLPANLMMDLVGAYQEEVNDMAETKNNRMRYCEVGGTVYDDEMDEDGGGVYISCEGEMILKWLKSEWKSLPNRNQAEHVESELNELGHPWAELSDIGVQNYNVVVTFKILPQKLVGFGGQEYAWAPENFNEFVQIVDTECDDKHAAVKQVCEVFFKGQGWMEGGAIVVLGHEVLNGEYSSSEWDAEAEEGYEYGEMESVRFTTDVTVSYADINDAIAGAAANYKGVNEQTAPTIAESRQFRIALRKAMTEPAQEAINKSYYPPIETETLSVSPTEIFIRIGYYASMDDPDGLIEVLKALVEYWDDWHNVVHDVVKRMFIWAARQAKVADQAAPGELSLEEQRLFDVEDLLRFS